MKGTFFIPLITTPVYAIRQTGIDIPFVVEFLKGAYKRNGKSWRQNQATTCPMFLKQQLRPQTIEQLKTMDIIFGIPPCRFLSMLNVRHDNFATGNSQNCMLDIARQAAIYKPKVFCFQNAPRFASAKPALQQLIPRLIQILKPLGYKFTIYKTTTLNHGLPQNRLRTFFLAYQGPHRYFDVYKYKNNPATTLDLISDLTDQKNDEPYCAQPVNALQKWFRKGNTQLTDHQRVESWFYWSELMKYCDKPNRPLMWDIMQGKYDWRKMVNQVTNQRDHDKLIKVFEHAQRKIAMGKGYWDASPLLAGDTINAVISKNAYRLVHPKKHRLLTLRQLRRFMGVPDRFVYRNKSRRTSLHYTTQNVPSFTYADTRQQRKKYVENKGKIVQTDKDLVYIQNISDPDCDEYYAYTVQQLKAQTKGLGRDNAFKIGTNYDYREHFLKRTKQD